MAKVNKVIDNSYGYYMYKDGTSHWGIGVHRGDECPILISKELHNAPENVKAPVKGKDVKDEDWNKTVEDYKKAVEAKNVEMAQHLAKKVAFYVETMKEAKEKQEAKDAAEKEEKAAKK